MDEEKLIQNIIDEAQRIEEDTEYSSKAHFNAGSRWKKVHYGLGFTIIICAALSTAALFEDYPSWIGFLALLASVLAGIQTFVNPEKSATIHKSAGDRILSLKRTVRIFRQVELDQLSIKEATKKINDFSSKYAHYTEINPDIPEWAFQKARKGIEDGQAQYQVDKK